METVYKLDGVRVVYYHATGEYEVWAMFANGADDFDWDVVLTTEDGDWAVTVADEVWNKQEVAT